MALMIGTGPFGRKHGEFNFDTSVLKPHTLYFEDAPKRVRALFGGETVVDSRNAKLLHETGLLPVYYFPESDVRMDLLEPTDHTTHCPFKGDASYWTLRAGEKVAENVAWGYPNPLEEAPDLEGYISFYFEKMDRWLEEEEEIIGHPRDPYHRIDVLRSSQNVEVRAGGETIASTKRPMVLFETGLPPRYYIPPEDVRKDLLKASETRTICPYKGVASYWSVETGGEELEDAAWSYPDPNPEAEKIEDHLCFQTGKDGLEVTIEN